MEIKMGDEVELVVGITGKFIGMEPDGRIYVYGQSFGLRSTDCTTYVAHRDMIVKVNNKPFAETEQISREEWEVAQKEYDEMMEEEKKKGDK